MRRLPFTLCLLAVLAAVPHAAPAADKVTTVPVRFAKGTSSATLSGQFTGYDTVHYTVGARRGQTMTVGIRGSSNANFNVFGPGATPGQSTAIGRGYPGSDWTGLLPADGTYLVQVYQMRASARRGTKVPYHLSIRVTGKARAPQPGTATSAALTPGFPATLRVLGDGYPRSGAPCRRLGESPAVVNWLDDSAMLVGCPDEAAAKAIGGRRLGVVDGITLVSMPMRDANAGLPRAAAPSARQDTGVAGRKALEAKCRDEVARQTRARVTGTRRIESTATGVNVFVDVEGAQAPWQCVGDSKGTLRQVFYSGSEGAL